MFEKDREKESDCFVRFCLKDSDKESVFFCEYVLRVIYRESESFARMCLSERGRVFVCLCVCVCVRECLFEKVCVQESGSVFGAWVARDTKFSHLCSMMLLIKY